MTRDKLLDFLTEIGAFAQPHSGETLGDHLMNVFDILDAADCPMDICLAGGLHSIYGTCHFRHVSEAKRDTILRLFGRATERLVYAFATLNRPYGLEYPEHLRDWKTGKHEVLAKVDLTALRLIEAANLLEQGVDLSKYPLIAGTLDELIESPEGESS